MILIVRLFGLTTIVTLWALGVLGQKRIIDNVVIKAWPSLGPVTVSFDGKYVMYNVENMPVGNKTLVLQSTKGNWKKEFIDVHNNPHFDASSKYVYFNKGNDSIGIITLGTDMVRYTLNQTLFKLKHKGVDRWCVIFPGDANERMVLKDLKTNREKTYLHVVNWQYNEEEQKLILCKVNDTNKRKQTVNSIELTSGKTLEIWEGGIIEDLTLDAFHHQFAFKSDNTIWYYKTGLSSAISLANGNSNGIDQDFSIGSLEHFSNDGKRLFFRLKENDKPKKRPEIAEVWSYNDMNLPSEMNFWSMQKEYLAVLNLSEDTIIRLENKGDRLSFAKNVNAQDTLVLVQNSINSKERWNIKAEVSWSLVSTKTLDFLANNRIVIQSPLGKYLIYSSTKNKGYFSYEIATGIVRNLTTGIDVVWNSLNRDDLSLDKYSRGINNLVWLNNDAGFLAYDRYDIWKLDPLNWQKPINITNGYGKRYSIVFDFALSDYEEGGIKNLNQLYLSAFNIEVKENGFFSTRLDGNSDPKLLTMGPFIYNTNAGQYVPPGVDFLPIKAKHDNLYVIRRMGINEAPNYFSTKDFKTFTSLTDLQPQKEYNWYKTELHAWKSFDGRVLKGILYKPENFNPNKKYPVIFYYYERRSDGLNAYIKPEPLCAGCAIDIPTYVSNGYLVFSPDIYYTTGDPMQGTYDAVVSAAKYLSKLSFVNREKMGIHGCSFGGLQTNFLVTHTDIFAAAVSSSSLSNMVSHYGSLDGGDKASLQSYYENGQARMGVSLWEKPESYIKNSPVFYVNKVNTPLLLMHTKKDDIYPYANILEFFTGLRRLGKKAWMLVYSNGNHGIYGDEADDFSLKMKSFFDYYLKDKPEPDWMIGNGENNIIVSNPSHGLLTTKELNKADSLLNLTCRGVTYR